MTRKSVLKWLDKSLQIGAKAGMKDAPHKPREAVIADDAKAWVVHLAVLQAQGVRLCGGAMDTICPSPACA
jgi:hypothetical protein